MCICIGQVNKIELIKFCKVEHSFLSKDEYSSDQFITIKLSSLTAASVISFQLPSDKSSISVTSDLGIFEQRFKNQISIRNPLIGVCLLQIGQCQYDLLVHMAMNGSRSKHSICVQSHPRAGI